MRYGHWNAPDGVDDDDDEAHHEPTEPKELPLTRMKRERVRAATPDGHQVPRGAPPNTVIFAILTLSYSLQTQKMRTTT